MQQDDKIFEAEMNYFAVRRIGTFLVGAKELEYKRHQKGSNPQRSWYTHMEREYAHVLVLMVTI